MLIEFSGNNYDHLPAIHRKLWKQRSRKSISWFSFLLLGGITFIAMGMTARIEPGAFNVPMFVGVLFVSLSVLGFLSLASSKQKYNDLTTKFLQHKKSLGKEWTVTIADDYVITSDAEHNAKYLWSFFTHYHITDAAIILQSLSGALAIVVPYSFITEQQVRELQEFCAKHLKLYAF